MDPSATNPVVPPPSSSAPVELHEAWDAIQRHAMPVLIGIAVALVVVLGFRLVKNRGDATRRDAQMLLTSAQSFDDLERVASDYAKTPAAPLALLKLGQAHYAAGNYAMAAEKYSGFITGFAGHSLVPAAEMGRIQCQEAQGQLGEALTAYQSFATTHTGHFLSPEALFGQGRCLEQLGRLTEARQLYEQFIAGNPESAWLSRAEESLERVTRMVARGVNPTSPPALDAPLMPASQGLVPIELPTTDTAAPPS